MTSILDLSDECDSEIRVALLSEHGFEGRDVEILSRILQNRWSECPRPIALELRSVHFISSTALALLLKWQQKAGKERCPFTLELGDPYLDRLLADMKLDALFRLDLIPEGFDPEITRRAG